MMPILTEHLKKVSLRAPHKTWRQSRRRGRSCCPTWHTERPLARLAEMSLSYQRAKIEEIIYRLNQDKARWHFRRSLFMNKIISKNLLPLLVHVKEDRGLMEVTIKALQELMTPVECLMPAEIMSQNNEGKRIIHELESVIVSTKKLFLDTRVTKSIIDVMSSFIQDSKIMSLPECELINQSLLLVRNLLHISTIPSPRTHTTTSSASTSTSVTPSTTTSSPTTTPSPGQQGGTSLPVTTEEQIMWNLFAQRFDNILLQLLTCSQQQLWNITTVQLVSLMYRNQQQHVIRKLVDEWLESSLSESSEDDENNPMSSSSSDAVSTSDPVSDSSERLSPVDGIPKDDKVQQMNRAEQTNLNENSDTSSGTNKKGDSSRDSGFGRSGSNLDSHDDSVSDSTKQENYRNYRSVENCDESEVIVPETEKDTNDEKLIDMETCIVNTGSPNECEMKSVGDNESVERLSDQGGCEGGSEGSSPTPSVEQQLDNENGCLMQYIQNDGKDNPCSLESIMNEDGEEEALDEIMAPIEENVDQNKMCKSQEPIKRPPNEEESGSSGDSSVKKPPPQLPKLHKNHPMTGQKRSRHTMSQKMLSDTQESNELSNSTGSECDEGPHAKRTHHQKPHKMLSKPRPAKMIQKAMQERNVKRTKLLNRKESNSIKAKALLHHHPTAEDISNLLKEFTVDFMLNGYANLLQGLKSHVLLPYQVILDKSHLLWLITYFFRFAVEFELELSQICPILSMDVVSYLVYEGVVMQEELERAIRSGETDLCQHIQRLHLCVTSLREFFLSFETCLKKEHTLIDGQHLFKMKEELGELVEVRQLFLLLIRMYRPGVLNINYLQDLIATNHLFLTILETSSQKYPTKEHFNIYNHIKQFATMDIMRQYGRVLENFNTNEESINDCVFTMMHHIAGDLRNINVLLQPCLLRVFLRIWNEGFELCMDWADLIEYVLRKCTRIRIEHPNKKDHRDSLKSVSEPSGIELTNEDLDQLYNLYSASTSEQDLMEKIKEICCDENIEEPIKKEVIQKLLARGFITTSECLKLCAEIPSIETIKSEGEVSLECDVMQVSSDSEDSLDVRQTSFRCSKKSMVEKSPVNTPGSPHTNKSVGSPHNKSLGSPLTIKSMATSSELLKLQDSLTLQGSPSSNELVRPQESTDDFQGDTNKVQEARLQESQKLNEKIGAMELKELRVSPWDCLEGNTVLTEDSTDWDDNNATIICLIDKLREEGLAAHVDWLQLQLLEACYSKVKALRIDVPKAEPIPFHFSLSNQSIPVVPWTCEHEEAFASPTYRQLLRELGLLLPFDTGRLFPRIPNFWCANTIFSAAKRLGIIPSNSLRVSMEVLQQMMQQIQAISLTGGIRMQANQAEDLLSMNGSSSIDCDDSSERVSDCSMENNRSSPSSPISSIDDDLSQGGIPSPTRDPPQHCGSVPEHSSCRPSSCSSPDDQDDSQCRQVWDVTEPGE